MQKNSLLVSFCIPTYNGMEYFSQLLESLLPILDECAELIICDDCSTDGTFEYASELALHDSRIKVFRNSKNLGMDRNFEKAVSHAQGKYVWFSGQDDLFGKDAYATFLQIVREHPEVDYIYFNYNRWSEAGEQFSPGAVLNLAQDIFFPSGEEYFKHIDHAPSFLAANIMRRSTWLNNDLSPFYDTYYIQVGCWLLHSVDARIYVVASSEHIVCRCPADSWKFTSAQMMFATMLGSLFVYTIVRRLRTGIIPESIYRKQYENCLGELKYASIDLREKGLVFTDRLKIQLHTIYGHSFKIYWGYVWPLTHTPYWLITAFRPLVKRIPTSIKAMIKKFIVGERFKTYEI